MVGGYPCRVCKTPKPVPSLARDCEKRCAAGLGFGSVEEFLEWSAKSSGNL